MSTLYLTFRFLHVTSAIVWVGGVIALAVVNARLARAGEASASQAVARAGVFFGTAVMMPAAVVTLLAGFALLGVTGRGLQLWTVWGLAGVFGSILLGALVLRRAGQELSALSARPSPDTARLSRCCVVGSRAAGCSTSCCWFRRSGRWSSSPRYEGSGHRHAYSYSGGGSAMRPRCRRRSPVRR